MKISDVLRDTSASSNSKGRTLTCTNPTINDIFTSTPYVGFYPHLPPLSATIFSSYPQYYTITDSFANLSNRSINQTTSNMLNTLSKSTSSKYFLRSKTLEQKVSPTNYLGYVIGFFLQYADCEGETAPCSIKSENLSVKSDSGFFSSVSSSGTPISRIAVRGYKKTYCFVCKRHINKEGKRSQGPRRHLLQHHVRRPLFQCPHCSHSSFYDKFHVTSHMKRIHHDKSDRLINRSSEFDSEVEEWYKRCFGDDKSIANLEEDKENVEESISLHKTCSTPPPILTPELPRRGITIRKNTVANTTTSLTDTPLKAPSNKTRKMSFMIEDILKPSPKRERKILLAKKRVQ
ncbi:hypothetical protein DICVIV_03890 [Dictyocaulus viviparus]|uniref:Uncharacterized protein n=1 Tax=Dictyocaulus viviparus TaxID=29172 RepID=A0A0D8XZ69_DICVI|nr:hypothetical protein DICVIV_03890 [Dictyocaulus viviparus]